MAFQQNAWMPFVPWFLAAAIVASLNGGSTAQEKSKTEATEDEDSDSDEAKASREAVKRAQVIARQFEVETFENGAWVKQALREKPLLITADPTRFDARGTIWAWGEKGRPLMVNEIYYQPSANTGLDTWVTANYNSSEKKLRANLDGRTWWREHDSGFKLKDLPNGPQPATSTTARQRQIKSLAAKFTAHEFWDPDNSRFELRLIERPLLTYSDPDKGLLDGALFTFANGTNPEILLYLEVHADPTGKTSGKFRFGVGRLAHAELHLAFEGTEVFTEGRFGTNTGPGKDYFLEFVKGPKAPAKPQ